MDFLERYTAAQWDYGSDKEVEHEPFIPIHLSQRASAEPPDQPSLAQRHPIATSIAFGLLRSLGSPAAPSPTRRPSSARTQPRPTQSQALNAGGAAGGNGAAQAAAIVALVTLAVMGGVWVYRWYRSRAAQG